MWGGGVTCAHMYKCLQRLKDRIRSPAAEVVGHCDPPDVGAAE